LVGKVIREGRMIVVEKHEVARIMMELAKRGVDALAVDEIDQIVIVVVGG
jgi:hypothetical protein